MSTPKEVITDEVRALVKYSSVGAVRLLIDFEGLRTPKGVWVPKSAIHSEYEEYNYSEFQTFEISLWWFKENKI